MNKPDSNCFVCQMFDKLKCTGGKDPKQLPAEWECVVQFGKSYNVWTPQAAKSDEVDATENFIFSLLSPKGNALLYIADGAESFACFYHSVVEWCGKGN